MKRNLLVLLLLVLTLTISVNAQSKYTIRGIVTDSTNKVPPASASIKIKESKAGTVANSDGSFTLQSNSKPPFTIIVSSAGFTTQEYLVRDTIQELHINLSTEIVMMDQIIVSASRIKESFLRSPVTIEVLNQAAIQQTPSSNFFDALENMKGVQMTTLSLGFKVPNTRGFAGTTNSRFLQMVDGIDNISPGIGAPIANAIGPTELDIESIELIPGAASATYGLNAINGISNMKTKDPFKSEGLSFYNRTGVNHINSSVSSATLFNEFSIRYAKILSSKFAFKINGSYSKGTDWYADDHSDQYFKAGNKTNSSLSNINPGEDLINKYGDEYNSDLKTIKLAGKNYDISRTGYFEKDLTDYKIGNKKFDLGLFYKFNDKSQLSYTYRIGSASNYYQRGNRIRLDGEVIQQHVATYKSDALSLQAYYTKENTGGTGSFNIRPLAENIDLAFKKPAQWYRDFTKGFNNSYNIGNSIEQSLADARSFADDGRYLPGTPAFDNVRNQIIHINNWDTVGAQLLLKSAFVHMEGQYDWSKKIKWVQLLTGFNFRKYIITPDGNEYVNPSSFIDTKFINKDFYYQNYGGFVQGTKKILADKLKFVGSVRIDKSDYFDAKINPRLAIVYSPQNQHNFRVSFQNGFRFPTLFEGFAFVNNGGVKRLGGLKTVSEHLNVFENSYLNTSVTAFKNAVNSDINNGVSQSDAIKKDQALLLKNYYTYIQPEHLNSLEIGYKGIWLNNKLFVDADYYLNVYNNFIGQLDVTQPYKGTIGLTGGQNDSTATYVYNGGSQVKKFKMWTNSKSNISNQGASLGLTYNLNKKLQVGGNVSFAQIIQISNTDAFTPAFNTPGWITNLSISGKEIVKNINYSIMWHWQDKFYWNSPLANGDVAAYSSVDAQLTYSLKKLKARIKVGGSNILNHYYRQYIGGPSIGGFYYTTFVLEVK